MHKAYLQLVSVHYVKTKLVHALAVWILSYGYTWEVWSTQEASPVFVQPLLDIYMHAKYGPIFII